MYRGSYQPTQITHTRQDPERERQHRTITEVKQMRYPRDPYFENWYHNNYAHRDKERFTFWNFIGSIRKSGVPSSSWDLVQIYSRYFADYKEEKEKRLESEIWTWIEGNPTAFNRNFYPEDNATARIRQATQRMIHLDITNYDFNRYWEDVIRKPFMLRVPRNDTLQTKHILERVHILCCDLHQIIHDTKYTLREMVKKRKETHEHYKKKNTNANPLRED